VKFADVSIACALPLHFISFLPFIFFMSVACSTMRTKSIPFYVTVWISRWWVYYSSLGRRSTARQIGHI